MAKRVQAKPSAEPNGTFHVEVNGHSLDGVQVDGVWSFTCPSWPALAAKWTGDTVLTHMLRDFMGRAMKGAIIVQQLTEGF